MKTANAAVRQAEAEGQVREEAAAHSQPSAPYSTKWMPLSRIGK